MNGVEKLKLSWNTLIETGILQHVSTSSKFLQDVNNELGGSNFFAILQSVGKIQV